MRRSIGAEDVCSAVHRKPPAILTALAAISVALLVALGTVGCRRTTPAEPAVEGPDPYGQLALLQQTGDRKLLDETARLAEENATPQRLMTPPIPDDQNAAAVLGALWPPTKVKMILAESDGYLPREEFRFSPELLQKASYFRKRYDAQRGRVQTALARPQCRFGLAFDRGWKADLSFAWMVRTAARVEAFAAAEAIDQGDIAAACRAVGTMFRLAECLAGEKHPAVRFHGLAVRTEACSVLQAVVKHPGISPNAMQTLYRQVQDSLDRWPPDADAWIGDRALGLYAYEMVRDGKLAELLTAAETQSFRREGVLGNLPAAAQRNVNADQSYYLRAMRETLALCRQPYYQRIARLDGMDADLKAKENTADYPTIAARLLLPGVRRGQLAQAQERAYCEAWAVALALGAGLDPPQYRISPVSGNPYQVRSRAGWIEVEPFNAETDEVWPSVAVPDRSAEPPVAPEKRPPTT